MTLSWIIKVIGYIKCQQKSDKINDFYGMIFIYSKLFTQNMIFFLNIQVFKLSSLTIDGWEWNRLKC